MRPTRTGRAGKPCVPMLPAGATPGRTRTVRILVAHVGLPAHRGGGGARLRGGARPAFRSEPAALPGPVVRGALDVRGRLAGGRSRRRHRVEPDAVRDVLDPRRGAQ